MVTLLVVPLSLGVVLFVVQLGGFIPGLCSRRKPVLGDGQDRTTLFPARRTVRVGRATCASYAPMSTWVPKNRSRPR